MTDGPIASTIREVVHQEFKTMSFRNTCSNYFIKYTDFVSFASLQKSYFGELFYLNIGYILTRPFPAAAATTVERCNLRARANDLKTPHDEHYIDRLLDATRPPGDLDRIASLRDFLRTYVFPALTGADCVAALGPQLPSIFGRAVMMDRHAQQVFCALDGTVGADRTD